MSIIQFYVMLIYIMCAASYYISFTQIDKKTYYHYLCYLFFGIVTIPMSIVLFIHKQLSKEVPSKDDFNHLFDKIFIEQKDKDDV